MAYSAQRTHQLDHLAPVVVRKLNAQRLAEKVVDAFVYKVRRVYCDRRHPLQNVARLKDTAVKPHPTRLPPVMQNVQRRKPLSPL